MPRPDETSATEPNESRDRGLVTHASAQRRWRASICAQPAQARRSALWRRLIYGERPEPIPSHRGTVQAPGSTGICCSGGGIRSAAYNLGALQALQREGRLQKADYLAGVSGGSYIAAAFCMVEKTSKDPATDDSDPDLLAKRPAFEPGSPEEQYLRNRSSYMAPDLAAKAYLGLRLVLGMAFNLIFLALPIAGLAILAGVFFYMPQFGGLRNGAHHVTTLAWAIPTAVAAAAILIGGLRILRRCPTDACRRFSETWAVRLFFLAMVIAVATLVLPELVDVMLTDGSEKPEVKGEGVAQTTGGAGVAG